MQKSDVIAQMQEVFDRVFLSKVHLSEELSAGEVDEWDSLTHLTLLIGMEKQFNIRFQTGEVEAARNVGQFADIILKHVK